ncbi:EAL domain-containing protein [Domibacillus indicus]|uniref:EAL domain-containing protein n=1 Tax=Domibacillus indicus TaxID=1437523 RepID=UPI000617D472|nr:EAL domain-containing protein [Domibacillus indicus]
MTGSCIECRIPIRFYEPGRLFISNENHWSFVDFQTIKEAEEELGRIGNDNVIGGIGKPGDQKPVRTAPLRDVAEWFSHQEVIRVIEKGQFVSFLQPIVETSSGNVYGYESLLRTNEEAAIPPGRLFHTAQKLGMHSYLDKQARESAILARKEHVKDGQKSFINFLPSTIYNPEFCLKHTFSVIEKYNVRPDDLVFEVVETEKIEDVDHLKKVLNVYKREGIKVALDDVGAGFSTIEMLEKLRPDYIKIDRSYISFCDQDSTKQSFINRALKTASDLGIIALAEGIERKEEYDYCRSAGIPLAQGYYFGRPSAEPMGNIQYI